jgi:hypothetical protein
MYVVHQLVRQLYGGHNKRSCKTSKLYHTNHRSCGGRLQCLVANHQSKGSMLSTYLRLMIRMVAIFIQAITGTEFPVAIRGLANRGGPRAPGTIPAIECHSGVIPQMMCQLVLTGFHRSAISEPHFSGKKICKIIALKCRAFCKMGLTHPGFQSTYFGFLCRSVLYSSILRISHNVFVFYSRQSVSRMLHRTLLQGI